MGDRFGRNRLIEKVTEGKIKENDGEEGTRRTTVIDDNEEEHADEGMKRGNMKSNEVEAHVQIMRVGHLQHRTE